MDQEENYGAIDYAESGEGPTVVLVPGSCSTGAAWRPVIAHWCECFRSVTTSLPGYGGTAERRTAEDADIARGAEVVEEVIRRAGGPVHLVGHSAGGMVSVAVALRKRVRLKSLTIVEAPAVELLRHSGEAGHYRAVREMTDAYLGAFLSGDRMAIKLMIDFYGGPGTFESWPSRVRDYAVATTPVNILDWASAYGFALNRGWLAAVSVPTLVMWGERSHPAIQRVNALLGEFIPGAKTAEVAGAAHFMIATHPKEVAAAIAGHVVGAELTRSEFAASEFVHA